MLTVNNGKSKVTKVRKRLKKTLFKAKTARVLFRDQLTKKLEIPKLYNYYNYNMLAVNVTDQLASLNSDQQRIRRGA
jgi:hypothetical protein